MQADTSPKQSASLISRRACATSLIALFFFAPYPLATSPPQSENPNDKKPAPTPTPALAMTAILKPTVTYREKAKYTEEARDNMTHGVVVLTVVFRVAGNISDIRVVRGLPYGLTETAIAAAKKIRFEPAIKDGQPVNVRGTLEYSFDLYDLSEKSIRKMLRNDFPALSEEVVKAMAVEIHKRGDTDTQKAWQSGRRFLENGVDRLPQSEQEELISLALESMRDLDESVRLNFEKLVEKSKTGQLSEYEMTQMIEFRLRGISRLSAEKRRRAEALYNQAAKLGTEIP